MVLVISFLFFFFSWCVVTLCLAFHWLCPFYNHCSPMSQGICMPIFCSSADIWGHCLWQMGRKWASANFCFFHFNLTLCLALYSIFYWHASLLLISWHSRALFVADGQKMVSAACCFSVSLLPHIVFYLSLAYWSFACQLTFEGIICGRWAENHSAAFWFFWFIPMLCLALYCIVSFHLHSGLLLISWLIWVDHLW